MTFEQRVTNVMRPLLEDLIKFYITGAETEADSKPDCDCCQSADELLRLEYLRGLL